ncbi:MAG: hypothetical protein ACO3LT_07045 [Ilumatobacteraceae bacterium]
MQHEPITPYQLATFASALQVSIEEAYAKYLEAEELLARRAAPHPELPLDIEESAPKAKKTKAAPAPAPAPAVTRDEVKALAVELVSTQEGKLAFADILVGVGAKKLSEVADADLKTVKEAIDAAQA